MIYERWRGLSAAIWTRLLTMRLLSPPASRDAGGDKLHPASLRRGWLVLGLLTLISHHAVWAQQVTTNKSAYLAGESVLIVGADFHPNESVTLQVLHSDGTLPSGAGHDPWTVSTDAEGRFTSTWIVTSDDSRASTFRLTADCGHDGKILPRIRCQWEFKEVSALTRGPAVLASSWMCSSAQTSMKTPPTWWCWEGTSC